MPEVIKMTQEQLEAHTSEATKGLQDSLDAKAKELAEALSDKDKNSELVKTLEKEVADLKEAQKKALAESNEKNQAKGVFGSQVKVKNKPLENIVGHAAILTALGNQERKSPIEIAADLHKSTGDEKIYEIINYMGKTLQVEDTKKFHSFVDRAKSIGIGSILEGAGLGDPSTDPELIQVLRPEASVQSMIFGKTVQLVNGMAKINIIETGSNATHVGSKSGGDESNATFGQRVLTAKKIASRSIIDNDRLRFGDAGLASEIEQDIINGIIQEWDRGILLGAGSNHEPLGLINAAGNTFSRAGSPDAVKIGKDLRKAKRYLQDDNINSNGLVWVFRPATRTAIEDQYTSNKDQMHYAARLENDGRLMGYNVLTTNNMPTSTDHTVLLVQPSELILGIGYGITLDVDSSIKFNEDQTTIRGLFSYDIAYKRTNGVCSITSTSDWETA